MMDIHPSIPMEWKDVSSKVKDFSSRVKDILSKVITSKDILCKDITSKDILCKDITSRLPCRTIARIRARIIFQSTTPHHVSSFRTIRFQAAPLIRRLRSSVQQHRFRNTTHPQCIKGIHPSQIQRSLRFRRQLARIIPTDLDTTQPTRSNNIIPAFLQHPHWLQLPLRLHLHLPLWLQLPFPLQLPHRLQLPLRLLSLIRTCDNVPTVERGPRPSGDEIWSTTAASATPVDSSRRPTERGGLQPRRGKGR